MIFQVLVWLFTILLALSLLLVLIGFFSPRISLFWYKKKRTRLRSFFSYSALSLLFLIMLVFSAHKYGKVQSEERKKVAEATKKRLVEERNVASIKLEKAEKDVEILTSPEQDDIDILTAIIEVHRAHSITPESLARMSKKDLKKFDPEITKKIIQFEDSHRQELKKLRSEIEVTRKRINKIDILLSQYY